MIEMLNERLNQIYLTFGIEEVWSRIYSLTTVLFTLFLLCVGLVALFKHFMTPLIGRLVKRTDTLWDDYLFDAKVLASFWNLVATLIFYQFMPDFSEYKVAYVIVEQGLKILIALFATRWLGAFLNKITHYTTEQEKAQHQTLIGVVQFIKLIAYFICAIIVVAFLFGKNPINLVAGLGAAATVLMLVFKDSILGLVAGIQLSANEMLKPGDWVAIEKLNIDGVIQKVSLTTVKIKNFDNTISTVPPYTLVSDSFRNWDNVFVQGARQVKRSFSIDVNTLRYLSTDELEKLLDSGLINEEDRQHSTPQVNLSLFRNYCMRFLSSHPEVHQGQSRVVRLLQSTPNGVPLELYFYLSHTEWAGFEARAALIQEQLIATMSAFGLKIFQHPTGLDVQTLMFQPKGIEQ